MSIRCLNWIVATPMSAAVFVSSRPHGPILGPVRTGILGGTFDPIHIAHLHAGECALRQAGLDRVLIIPAGDPWQKTGVDITPGHHRMEMTRIAVEGVEGLFADSREVGRQGPTYTFDTLATFPDDEETFLIVGSDTAVGLPSWHRFEDILDRVTVLIAPRRGMDVVLLNDIVPGATILEMPMLEVSATAIRRSASQGLPYRFLVTEGVHRYIEDNNLYAKPPKDDIVRVQSEMEELS